MSKFTRRQFIGTTAAGVAAAPHMWVRGAEAQAQKQVSVLTWSHFVPAYDKWFDQWGQEWATKNNVKLTIDHIPHLNIPAKIAAEVATQSGHDIVQMAGSGTEKFGPALMDVQDLADKLGNKYGGWTPLAANYSSYKGKFHSIPTTSSTSRRPLPQGPVDRDRDAERSRYLGRAAARAAPS